MVLIKDVLNRQPTRSFSTIVYSSLYAPFSNQSSHIPPTTIQQFQVTNDNSKFILVVQWSFLDFDAVRYLTGDPNWPRKAIDNNSDTSFSSRLMKYTPGSCARCDSIDPDHLKPFSFRLQALVARIEPVTCYPLLTNSKYDTF